jgi:hypothetical protein
MRKSQYFYASLLFVSSVSCADGVGDDFPSVQFLWPQRRGPATSELGPIQRRSTPPCGGYPSNEKNRTRYLAVYGSVRLKAVGPLEEQGYILTTNISVSLNGDSSNPRWTPFELRGIDYYWGLHEHPREVCFGFGKNDLRDALSEWLGRNVTNPELKGMNATFQLTTTGYYNTSHHAANVQYEVCYVTR